MYSPVHILEAESSGETPTKVGPNTKQNRWRNLSKNGI